jgi:uncharacterized iron-regulated membrane protein
MHFDWGHLVLLLLVAFGVWWLRTHPTRPANPDLRKFLWGALAIFAVVWLGSLFGWFGDVAVSRPILP